MIILSVVVFSLGAFYLFILCLQASPILLGGREVHIEERRASGSTSRGGGGGGSMCLNQRVFGFQFFSYFHTFLTTKVTLT